jgi:hypothetical protein
VQKFAADRDRQSTSMRQVVCIISMARDGGLSKWGGGSRSPAGVVPPGEIELQALATLAALAPPHRLPLIS